MGWIEVVRLRVPPGQRAEAEEELDRTLVHLRARPDDPPRVEVYRNLDGPGDLALVVRWNLPELEPHYSEPAQSLAGHLRQLGLVNHSVWSEVPESRSNQGST